MARDGGLAHRRADFVPLGPSQNKLKTGKKDDTLQQSYTSVLAILAAEDLSPQEVAGEPSADELHRTIRQFRRGQAATYSMNSLLGVSSAMRKVRAQVAAAANSAANVLVIGPAGSGRGHIARAIHYRTSGDLASKLIPVQCDVAGDELLRRALDALRGPDIDPRRRPTLLLEHVECLTADHQAQLLSVIRDNPVPARIIATVGPPSRGGLGHDNSRKDESVPLDSPHLPAEATPGLPAKFDQALVDAMSTITIHIPRLVDRLDDLPILAQSFLEACNVGSTKQVGSIRPEALDLLALHSWPGELVELRAVIAAAHRASTSHEITVANLPAVIHHASQAGARSRRRPERVALDQLLSDIEKEAIGRALAQTGGNKTEAAELLGMTRPRLYRRLVQLGLVSDTPSETDMEQPEFVEQDPGDRTT
jgi:DNA-binding NtrC family response regulator